MLSPIYCWLIFRCKFEFAICIFTPLHKCTLPQTERVFISFMSIMSSHRLRGACLLVSQQEDGKNFKSLSKTTKLLLLDSLLQEVCIESGLDGSLTLSLLGLSVCLVSHNLLYSGLKKAFSMTMLGSIRDIKLIYPNNLLCLSRRIEHTFQYVETSSALSPVKLYSSIGQNYNKKLWADLYHHSKI